MQKEIPVHVPIGSVRGVTIYVGSWKFPNRGVYRYGLSAKQLIIAKARRF